MKTYTNADFYDKDGKFLVDKAREAYFDMFRRFNYPISDKLRKDMWILDFAVGDFAQVGMAGIFWVNRQDYSYFGHEIYLLPGQMIPEHKHVAHRQGAGQNGIVAAAPRHDLYFRGGRTDAGPAGQSAREPGAS